MPTLVLQDFPVEIYAKLAESASRRQLSPEEEAKRILCERFSDNGNYRLPDEPFSTEETPVPFDLPRPGEGVIVRAVRGGRRRPSPLIVDSDE